MRAYYGFGVSELSNPPVWYTKHPYTDYNSTEGKMSSPRIRALLFCLLLSAATTLTAAGYPTALAHEVPPYPQAKLDSANEDARGASAILNVNGTVEQAARYYRDKLSGKGWKQTADAAIGSARALEFSRDKSSIAISIMPTSAGTTIAVTLNR